MAQLTSNSIFEIFLYVSPHIQMLLYVSQCLVYYCRSTNEELVSAEWHTYLCVDAHGVLSAVCVAWTEVHASPEALLPDSIHDRLQPWLCPSVLLHALGGGYDSYTNTDT